MSPDSTRLKCPLVGYAERASSSGFCDPILRLICNFRNSSNVLETEPDFFAVSYPNQVVFDYDVNTIQEHFILYVEAIGAFCLGLEDKTRDRCNQILQDDQSSPDANDLLYLLNNEAVKELVYSRTEE